VHTAAVGFRVHSGWAAAVVVSGSRSAPVIVERRRIELVKTFTYTYRQPYHTAKQMPPPDARKFVREVASNARRLALASLRSLQKELAAGDFKLVRAALLLASGPALPDLEKILASHALIHTADGELFRESWRSACAGFGVALDEVREKELFATGAKLLRADPAALHRRVAALGQALGPPWTQDEKYAALAAWLSLAR
jgi:hypothetical protein